MVKDNDDNNNNNNILFSLLFPSPSSSLPFHRYDKRKGFFYQVMKGDKTKCLGRGKGRIYPPMN